MKYQVTVEGIERLVEVSPHPEGGWTVAVDGGEARRFSGGAVGPAEWMLGPEGEPRRNVGLFVRGERAWAQLDGHSWEAEVVDARRAALRASDGEGAGEVRSPMPGAVVRLLAAEGDTVQVGQAVVIVEAMKMENELRAEVDGIVVEVHVAAGQPVDGEALLLRIEPSA